jgi:flagellar motor protein MotB
MAERKQQDEGGGSGMGWIVTFSDCMTLLLCFFVLLMTFSSFEEIKYATLAGAFVSKNNTEMMENPREPKDSYKESPRRENETRDGSRMPTEEDRTYKPPPPPPDVDVDIYEDRIVFYVPSRNLFWGKGVGLRNGGEQHLKLFAKYLKAMPCRVVIGETSPQDTAETALRRSYSVLKHFGDVQKIDLERFSLASPPYADTKRHSEPMLQLTLMNVKIEQ